MQRNIFKLFNRFKPNIVLNMAAQAGVRYSLNNPQAYIDSNITAMLNILELMKDFDINKLLYDMINYWFDHCT